MTCEGYSTGGRGERGARLPGSFDAARFVVGHPSCEVQSTL